MSLCGSWGYALAFSLEWRMLQGVNIFHLLGVSALQERSTILFCVSLGAKPGSQAGLYCSFLAASPLSLWPLLPLISTPFYLFLELREGHEGWMKSVSYKWEREDTERPPSQEPRRVPLNLSYWILSFDQQNADLKILDWGLHIMTHYM